MTPRCPEKVTPKMAEREPKRNLIDRDPFRQLLDVQDEIGRWWDRDWWPWPTMRLARRTGGWTPRIDVYEEGEEVVVSAELPGVQREDIHVTVEENSLVLQGERTEQKEVKEEKYYRMERSFGSFYRRIPFEAPVAPDSVKASFKDGVLEVRVPKPAPQAPKLSRVSIQ